MVRVSDPRVVSSLKSFTLTASLVSIVVGCLGLLSWALNFTYPHNVLSSLVAIKPIVAWAFGILGLALHLLSTEQTIRRSRVIGKMCAWAVIILGVLILSETLVRMRLGIGTSLIQAIPSAINCI